MNSILDSNQEYTREVTRDFFKSVYMYMFMALAVSGIVAYMTGTEEFFAKYFVQVSATGAASVSPLFWVVVIAPLGLGILMQFMYRKLSYGVLLALYIAYSVLMGLSLSSLLLMYSGQSIALTFFVAAGAFAGMAVLGFTTKTDLTKFGSLLYMAFIGIFIAGIANIWIGSGALDFGISVIGVFVFTGLTAYYMQTLKRASQDNAITGVERDKLALVGGLILYILFINLFMSLLRLMGD
ncbi:MAG: Bax inhibitor-1/YccA family protein [Crocinitomicaceae bacterium]|nr:Bax inhibitor-1/YccA family protein [Crocinitomicaceae bacterium]